MTFLNKDVVIQMLKILAESTLDELHLEMGELKPGKPEEYTKVVLVFGNQ